MNIAAARAEDKREDRRLLADWGLRGDDGVTFDVDDNATQSEDGSAGTKAWKWLIAIMAVVVIVVAIVHGTAAHRLATAATKHGTQGHNIPLTGNPTPMHCGMLTLTPTTVGLKAKATAECVPPACSRPSCPQGD